MDWFYGGIVSRLMPIADGAKGTVPVRVRLKVPTDEEGQYLNPETVAVVRFYDQFLDDEISTASTAVETINANSGNTSPTSTQPATSESP